MCTHFGVDGSSPDADEYPVDVGLPTQDQAQQRGASEKAKKRKETERPSVLAKTSKKLLEGLNSLGGALSGAGDVLSFVFTRVCWEGWVYILTSIPVFGLTVGLIASQPSGESPAKVNFIIFVVIFSYLCWLISLPYPRGSLGDSRDPGLVVFRFIAFLNVVFYFSATMAMTVALSPAGNCDDIKYLEHIGLIDRVKSRCRAAQADVAFLWFCKSPIVMC
jgi:Membrane-associating domain